MESFYGNFLVMVKAYVYQVAGPRRTREASKDAVLNANYILRRITEYYDLPYDRHCKHEFVVSPPEDKEGDRMPYHGYFKRLLDSAYTRRPLLPAHRGRSYRWGADGDRV